MQAHAEFKLSMDLENLLNNDKFSDVKIIVNEIEYHAHKAILAARSAVFDAMFTHDMIEKLTNTVIITDVENEIFDEMLHFIYTGQTPNIEKMGADLLAAADKYLLDELKELCEEALCGKLSMETAGDTLILADLHSAHKLKEKTIEFINFHTFFEGLIENLNN